MQYAKLLSEIKIVINEPIFEGKFGANFREKEERGWTKGVFLNPQSPRVAPANSVAGIAEGECKTQVIVLINKQPCRNIVLCGYYLAFTFWFTTFRHSIFWFPEETFHWKISNDFGHGSLGSEPFS